ncbi:hypothetical protein ACWD5R_06185 [Streptomyces sp. NPDC002514]|uniref:hypothetical protein n=1 Tax=Streptomyces sp. NPDC001270 TaxID=3364554 RepID=UPI0036797085
MSETGAQQSPETSTRNGIRSLELAYGGIQRILQNVEGTKNNLSSSYQGSDGGAYGRLLGQWDDQVVRILNLQDMTDRLNTSLVEHGKAQGSTSSSRPGTAMTRRSTSRSRRSRTTLSSPCSSC